MKNFFALVVLGFCLCIEAFAATYTVGKTTLTGAIIEIDNLDITASGGASLSLDQQSAPNPGTIRLNSIKADTIKLVLFRDSAGRISSKEASAIGKVLIRAKRADTDTDAEGKQVIVLRDVTATADSAKLPDGQNVVLLSGNAIVKVTEPGRTEPLALISGDTINISLAENRIKVTGRADKPAEITLTSKEEQK